MKTCPYCGKKYPDDATNCLIDRELLLGNIPQSLALMERAADVNTPYLTFPDYQWTARDGWKFLGMLLVFELVIVGAIYALDLELPGFHQWRKAGFGYFLTGVLHFAAAVLTAAYFARTETLASFWKGFGLNRKPSNYVWFGVTMALIIRFASEFMLAHGWGKGVLNYGNIAFRRTLGFERCFFLLPPLLLAPFLEEAINRGFLYKAFRGSYSFTISTALLVAWTANTHDSQYSQSLLAAVALSLLTVVQCYLREKSDSLWDCIVCHFSFNASLWFFNS